MHQKNANSSNTSFVGAAQHQKSLRNQRSGDFVNALALAEQTNQSRGNQRKGASNNSVIECSTDHGTQNLQLRRCACGGQSSGITDAVNNNCIQCVMGYSAKSSLDKNVRGKVLFETIQKIVRSDILLELNDPNDDSKYGGLTNLMVYSAAGDMQGVRKHMAQITQKDNNGQTALYYASQYGHLEVVKLLLDQEQSIFDNSGQTALMRAAMAGQVSVIKHLVGETDMVGKKDKNGMTALMFAALNNKLEAVEILREYELGISRIEPKDMWQAQPDIQQNALEIALFRKDRPRAPPDKLVNLLMFQNGIELSVEAKQLSISSRLAYIYSSIVNEFDKKQDCTLVDAKSRGVLIYAILGRNNQYITTVFFTVMTKTEDGSLLASKPPVLVAVQVNNADALECFAAAMKKNNSLAAQMLEARNTQGNNALIIATQMMHIECVKVLLPVLSGSRDGQGNTSLYTTIWSRFRSDDKQKLLRILAQWPEEASFAKVSPFLVNGYFGDLVPFYKRCGPTFKRFKPTQADEIDCNKRRLIHYMAQSPINVMALSPKQHQIVRQTIRCQTCAADANGKLPIFMTMDSGNMVLQRRLRVTEAGRRYRGQTALGYGLLNGLLTRENLFVDKTLASLLDNRNIVEFTQGGAKLLPADLEEFIMQNPLWGKEIELADKKARSGEGIFTKGVRMESVNNFKLMRETEVILRSVHSTPLPFVDSVRSNRRQKQWLLNWAIMHAFQFMVKIVEEDMM